MKPREKKKIALVLSGGGIKAAAFHIGVCLALKEKGFRFAGGLSGGRFSRDGDADPMTIRCYVGSSAGAFVSSVLASGYSLEALVNAFQVGAGARKSFDDFGIAEMRPIGYRQLFNLNTRGIAKSVPSFLMKKSLVKGGIEAAFKNLFHVNGLFTTSALEKYLSKHVLPTNDFSKLGVDLFVVGTQLNHSRKVIFGDHRETWKDKNLYYVNYAKISEAVAASASLPPVYAPYGIEDPDGKKLYFFDGEIRDTLSTHIAADHGADLVISSYSVQPYHYTEEMGSLHEYGIPVILNQALYQVIQQKIEKHIEHQHERRAIFNAVDGYLKQANIGEEHRIKILDIITKKINYRSNVDYIYIHPKPQNYEMFFVDHFSLNPKILERIVRIGFKSGINALRQAGI